jgi:hypothetical protein
MDEFFRTRNGLMDLEGPDETELALIAPARPSSTHLADSRSKAAESKRQKEICHED